MKHFRVSADIEAGAASRSTPGDADGAGVDTFVLWPHRSLGPTGVVMLLGAVALGFVLVVFATSGLDSWPIPVISMTTGTGLGMALWRSSRAMLRREIVEITPRVIRITRSDGMAMSEPIEFSTHWARITVSTDRYVEDRIVLSEGRRRASIGNFLSPGERRRLATELRRSVARRQAAR